ncbi:MAG: MBL fold metallo-hydrolase [Abyssibacter sp.]|uniref:MBL fold metallo-hydrolase n=1 Tax=Abyssibacter sp. TaxID=2320200 RepID=UPI003219D7FA
MRRLVTLLASLTATACAPVWQGEPSDHFDGVRFHNDVPVQKSLIDVMRWMLSRDPAAWPEQLPPPEPVRPVARTGPGELIITPVNHATLLIQMDGLNVLTDPIWSKRCSPVQWAGPARVHAPAVRWRDLPPIDLVLISHNHYDHLDLATLQALESAHKPVVIAPLNNAYIIEQAGIPRGRIVELDWWERSEHAPITVTATPAQHWSRRGIDDARKSLWSGFWLQGAAGTVFFAGDTGYGPLFTQMRERLGTPDMALLPIGAYEPRWFMQAQHMNPAEAVQAFLDLGANRALGMHYGTFQLTDEARDAPLQALSEALHAQQIPSQRFEAARFGAVYRVSPLTPGVIQQQPDESAPSTTCSACVVSACGTRPAARAPASNASMAARASGALPVAPTSTGNPSRMLGRQDRRTLGCSAPTSSNSGMRSDSGT